MLKKSKEKFKSGLLASAEEFKKSVASLQDEFNLRGPVSAKMVVVEAQANIKAFQTQIDSLKTHEGTIRRGLNIFKIEQQSSKALTSLETDVTNLEQVMCY